MSHFFCQTLFWTFLFLFLSVRSDDFIILPWLSNAVKWFFWNFIISVAKWIVGYTLNSNKQKKHPCGASSSIGAGEENRTLTVSLEGWSSTIKLHPQVFNERPSDVLLSHLRTTLGAKELNCCVRYGNRCALLAIITRPLKDSLIFQN